MLGVATGPVPWAGVRVVQGMQCSSCVGDGRGVVGCLSPLGLLYVKVPVHYCLMFLLIVWVHGGQALGAAAPCKMIQCGPRASLWRLPKRTALNSTT